MMSMFWVVIFVALTGSHLGHGLPLRSTPPAYPHDPNLSSSEGWGSNGMYAAVPALALVIAAVGFLFGCTWCYRHKDCKPNAGADNQLFSASATHLHDARRSHPPDSGFSEPANNNISEDNNNGPISLREMQNIANNNAAAYIVSENEERNRVSRESVVEFEPLPSGIRVVDPLEHCADWFGGEDIQRNQLQYLREIGRGWFGRVVEGEIEENGATSTVAVKILNQNASLEDKARFLDEGRVYRDLQHETILAYLAKCLDEDPWILIFELCPMDLQQYLTANRSKMAILNESGVPLQLLCDVASGLAYMHSRGYLYGNLSSSNVLVRELSTGARAVLGHYSRAELNHEFTAPETRRHPPEHTTRSEVWSLGTVVWEVCTWGEAVPSHSPPPPDLPCPYRNHLHQVMQLCWNPDAEARPSASQVHALINHLHLTHARADTPQDDGYGSSDFEERWQRLKPNTIPKLDEHIAIVHAPSTSMASHFTGSDQEDVPTINDTLSVDMDTAVSRSSSIMSDKDPLSVQIKSESLTNLHGSLEDVRNIYLTHNETAALECHQGNIALEDKDNDRSDSSVDPWLKDIIAGSQDDVSYYRDVSDVIKNLDNILNSEKTSSSESSHQASPSRDNLSLDCKKEYPVQSSLVKSPGISNFQNILESFDTLEEDEACKEDDVDRDTIGTLSHSFERHSDTISQHTLENLTPDTPIKDIDIISNIESQIEAEKDLDENIVVDKAAEETHEDAELPKEVECSDSKLPKLRELCVASLSSVSEHNELLNVREDCVTPCDSNLAEIVRTDKVKTKSIDNINEHIEETLENKSEPEEPNEVLIQKPEYTSVNSVKSLKEIIEQVISVEGTTLSESVNESAANTISSEILVPAIEANADLTQKDETDLNLPIKLQDVLLEESIESPINETLHPSDLISPYEVITDSHNQEEKINQCTTNPIQSEDETHEVIENVEKEVELLPLLPTETPEPVQNTNSGKSCQNIENEKAEIQTTISEVIPEPELPTEIVQNITEECVKTDQAELINYVTDETKEDGNGTRSDSNILTQQSNDSTVYMDLINDTNSELKDNITLQDDTLDINIKGIIQSCLDQSNNESACSLARNESTVYLDLPSLLKETGDFLHSERVVSSQDVENKSTICVSTPKGSECSADTLEASVINDELAETIIPDEGPSALMKLEQRCVPESISPFESPTKSHHTDTYDENSSVVLGPFENCAIESFKGAKAELVELPKEELLAFSSNFSDINLETPSPLRDGNFLNEVPDIVQDEFQFDDITVSDSKPENPQTDNTDETDDQSGTAKRVSPLTPPNSPGISLASTSQQKYVVDIDLDPPETSYPPIEPDSGLSSLQKEIDLNQIELQITSKLAMAENENNMNIEYSGPLSVEGLVEDSVILSDSDAIPESYLAGNGGHVEELTGGSLDEECVKALRNELELKLPLAQVASIEPAVETEWSELPPPPELVVSYCSGALSPIAEETRHQLSAYENDAWNASTRTDSSESYPEPCNLSTDEVTDLPTGGGAPSGSNDHSTYTIQSKEHSNNTYTIQKDIPSSKELSMSADSLNGSPYKKQPDNQSPVDDKTYNKKDEEKDSNCERISQVSPFLMSPSTDSSAPVDSDNIDNATGVSTLSKTTVPTDAKLSKPSECLSKATSIDSWCSNDTLYNVEENFDDLAMDPDVQLDFEIEKENKSESTDTLTHHDEDKDLSHCSTYIIHDSKSDACETFSPDSITAHDNHTYTKAKTEATGTTPSIVTKSDVNDSAITTTPTRDLAYGTLPSYSNCTTELVSIDDPWKLPQPELVRRSPITNDISFTPPKVVDVKGSDKNVSPQIESEPCVKKMDSVDISCLQDSTIDSQHKSDSTEDTGLPIDINNSPNNNYRTMAPSVTSTPLAEAVVDDENVKPISMNLPEVSESPECIMHNIPNFQMFIQSAEIRPQDLCLNASDEPASTQDTDTGLLLEGESKTLSRNSQRDSAATYERSPSYSDFEKSAVSKPQELYSRDKSSQSFESGLSSGDFRQFENSVRYRPQDISSAIDASSLLLKSERKSSELATGNSADFDHTSQSSSRENHNEVETLNYSPPNPTTLQESHEVSDIRVNIFVSDYDVEEETEQPHSIIITEMPKDVSRESQNRSFDSHFTSRATEPVIEIIKNSEESLISPIKASKDSKESVNVTYDSHTEEQSIGLNHTYESHVFQPDDIKVNGDEKSKSLEHIVNGLDESEHSTEVKESQPPKVENTDFIEYQPLITEITANAVVIQNPNEIPNGSLSHDLIDETEIKCNGNSEKYATVNFINETFEELMESNVDDLDKDVKTNSEAPVKSESKTESNQESESKEHNHSPQTDIQSEESPRNETQEGMVNGVVEDKKMTSVTENFLQNEKKFCQLDSYLPLLSDIRFTGPATEIMSTSFQDSPTSPTSPECEQDKRDVAVLVKEWDSDSDSNSSNSSSGEFIWKQRSGGSQARGAGPDGAASSGSGDSGSGSEGDEVEFVPSSWDCRAAPAKSSLRSLEHATPESKKRVVFKRQKYHCVYEYPREAADVEAHSPAAYLPDLSTYCEWDPTSAEEAELGYGQLFGAPSPLDMYPLRAGIAFGPDYDEDFFISSSARPFESLGIMSTTSQFFPGMHVKPALLDRDLDDVTDDVDDFPPPPSPLPAPTLAQTRTPSLDFTTPDSGVEDITPGSTSTDEDFKTKKLEDVHCWKPLDSGSSSESVSPSSPGEALGGLRHTRDKLKLDLPPSPHIPSPRHNRVFNFVLDKPKRHRVPDERPVEAGSTPLVMTDETPIPTTALPLPKDEEVPVPEPTFSTFGKSPKTAESEQKIILDDVEANEEVKAESPVKAVEPVKGEGTVLDSGDEDSGIESSSKATLERKTPNVS